MEQTVSKVMSSVKSISKFLFPGLLIGAFSQVLAASEVGPENSDGGIENSKVCEPALESANHAQTESSSALDQVESLKKIGKLLWDARSTISGNSGSSLKFATYVMMQSPSILKRAILFEPSKSAVREEIVLHLADLIEDLNLTPADSEARTHASFRLILFWPEALYKLHKFAPTAESRARVAARVVSIKVASIARDAKTDPLRSKEFFGQIFAQLWIELNNVIQSEDPTHWRKRLKFGLEKLYQTYDKGQLNDLGFDRLIEVLNNSSDQV